MSKKEYNIGDTWEFISPSGSIGKVWLAEIISHKREIWRWSFRYSDGSGNRFDWTPSKASAVSECSQNFPRIKTRFVKVKATPQP